MQSLLLSFAAVAALGGSASRISSSRQAPRPHLLPSAEQLARAGLVSETTELLHFLAAGNFASSSAATLGSLGLNLGAMPPYESFMPACREHVRKVVVSVDHSYTDVQLEEVLEQQCKLDHAFDHVREDGFKQHDACKDFASNLAHARDEELRSGSSKGYEDFCEDYYVHRGGKLPHHAGADNATGPSAIVAEVAGEAAQVEKAAEAVIDEEKEDKTPSSGTTGRVWKLCAVVLGVVVIVAVVLYAFSKRKPSAASSSVRARQ